MQPEETSSSTPSATTTPRSLTEALAVLLGHELTSSQDHAKILRFISRHLCDTLQIARVSIWLFNAEHTRLSCAESYDSRDDRHASGSTITDRSHPGLFKNLRQSATIQINAATRFEGSQFFSETYLNKHRLTQVLSVAIRNRERMSGLIWLEYNAEPPYPPEEVLHFARATASCVGLSIGCETRRLTEETRNNANRRLNQIIEFLPDATYVIDDMGVVVAWNRAIERLTGTSKEEVIGRGDHIYAKVFYGTKRPMLVDLALNPRSAGEELYSFIQRDGDTLVAEAHITNFNHQSHAVLWGTAHPLYDERGHITGAIESIRDITLRKQTEKAAEDWRRRYEMVAVASGQITYEHIPEIGCILWSRASDFILGLHLADLGGTARAWFDLMHPEDREQVRSHLEESMRSGNPFETEYRLLNRNGEYLWFKDRAYFTMNAAGQRCLLGMLSDITAARSAQLALKQAHDLLEHRVKERTEELDITNQRLIDEIVEREQTQMKLESSEEKYRAMVDSLPQVVFELDLQGNIVRLNRQAYESGGINPDSLKHGLHIRDFLSPEDHPRLAASWERLIRGESLSGAEYTVIRRDGSTFPATTYAQPIMKDGEPQGVTGFLIDETPRKRAQEALQKAHAELEERVILRTAELAESNRSLRELLNKQEMNIGLAHRVLMLVNSLPPRHIGINETNTLFVAAQLIPRHIEGGDHYFVRNGTGEDAHNTYISLKDESGHEVGCILRSIITDLIHTALLGQTVNQADLARTITNLNAELCRSNLFQEGEFLTSVNLQLDRRTLRLSYLLAGHPPFMLIRKGKVLPIPESDRLGMNLPLGMIANHEFEAGHLSLEPGDKLLLYTDGLLDAAGLVNGKAPNSGELPAIMQEVIDQYGDAPVKTLAGRFFRRLTQHHLDDARLLRGFPDDIAMLVAEIETSGDTLEEVLHPGDLTELRNQRSELLERISSEWREREIHAPRANLQFVLEEALMNAWRHGNQCSPEKKIIVRRSYGNDARIDIIDEGRGFPWSGITDPTAYENRMKPSGRGLFMIRRFAGEATWSDDGRHLTLYFGSEHSFSQPDSVNPLHNFRLWNNP